MTDDLAPSHRARSHRPRPRRSGYSRNVLSPARALLVFSLASAASAQGHDGRWSLYAEGVFLSPKDDRAAATPSGGVPPAASYGLDGDGAGFGLGAEVRLTRRLGIEAGIASVDLDVRLRAGAAGGAVDKVESASFEIYLAGVDWHLTGQQL